MDDIPFYKKPWFYITFWLVFLLAFYFWQIYRLGGVEASLVYILFDLVCIFPLFFIAWMAFFSQFVLPVKTFPNRQKIFDRLIRHLFRRHGPALFIENGEIKEHSGERLKKGPGVVWLDSASAALTRTTVAIKKTIGPGVHFTETNEYIEQTGTLDLHIQSQKLGPKDEDKPFDEKKVDNPYAENKDETSLRYTQIQNRRKQVSAITRDGIELVPDISVSFRVKTGFPQDGQPGSRFGYRTGTTMTAKHLEAQDKDVLCRALLGEGINPNINADSPLHRVAWNRLPAMLAVDLWREYASKFTLEEFFDQTQVVHPPSQQIPQSTTEVNAPGSPMKQAEPDQKTAPSGMAGMLHEINRLMERAIDALEKNGDAKTKASSGLSASPSKPAENGEPSKQTALQVINELVKARLTQSQVDILNETGKRVAGQVDSEEFQLLHERGLKVQSVSISNIRLHPTVQEHLIKSWSANWLNFAKAESGQLDLQRNLIETSAQEVVQLTYARQLSREVDELCKKGRPGIEQLLKSLLLRSRAMIRSGKYSNSLRRRMITELQDIEDMIKWMGEDGK